MMVKDPKTNLVINRDDSHYQVLKLRRQQRKQAKLVDSQLASVSKDLELLREQFEQLLLIKQQG